MSKGPGLINDRGGEVLVGKAENRRTFGEAADGKCSLMIGMI